MYKLTIVAAAFAAGMMTFAANAQAPKSPRAQDAEAIQRVDAGQKVDRDKKARKTAKAKDAAEACPYLFGCDDAKAKPKKASTAEAGEKKVASKSAKAGKKVAARKSAKAGRKNIDLTHTSSIATRKTKGKASASSTQSGKYSTIISRYAAEYGVPVSLARAVIHVESNYRPHLTGRAGEVGLMQIKPSTARMLGYSGSVKGLYDPETNIKYGMKYLAMAQDVGDGTTCGTILKYNAGHAATRMNPVSSAYCSKVKVRLAALGTSI